LDPTTIIFAIIAIFVIWKLYSVLGTRTGAERPPFDPTVNLRRDSTGAGPGQVIRLPGAAPHAPATPAADPQRWRDFVEPGSKGAAGLDAIASVDQSFEAASFLVGAKAAYEAIVTAFASGDRAALGSLLSHEVMENFGRAIGERQARQETMQTKIVSIDSAKIDDARMSGQTAQVAVRFLSKLISATRDRTGAVIEGSPDKVADHVDLWTFARDVSSRDPNWRLIATESAH
jgi:predicted lipid-binding transport protein (Tim44 family)